MLVPKGEKTSNILSLSPKKSNEKDCIHNPNQETGNADDSPTQSNKDEDNQTAATTNRSTSDTEDPSYSSGVLQVFATQDDLLSEGECSPERTEKFDGGKVGDSSLESLCRRSKTPEVTTQRYRSTNKQTSTSEQQEKGKKASNCAKSSTPRTRKLVTEKSIKIHSDKDKRSADYKSNPSENKVKCRSRSPSSKRRKEKKPLDLSKSRVDNSTHAKSGHHSSEIDSHTSSSKDKYSRCNVSTRTQSDSTHNRRSNKQQQSTYDYHKTRRDRHSDSKQEREDKSMGLRSDEYPDSRVIALDKNSGKVRTYESVPTNLPAQKKKVSTERSKSPVRFPSPDMDVIEIPKPAGTHPTPPLVVLSDSD